MQYVEAPTDLSEMEYRWPHPWVFMAGGITDCPPWQWELAEMLDECQIGTVFQPRRKNFPIDDPSAAQEQIQWEHTALWNCDIFSMWFCNSPSVQPICMFELGAHTTRWLLDRKDRGPSSICVGVEPGYQREQDVYIQMDLLCGNIFISDTLEDHAQEIISECNDSTSIW